MGRRPRPRGPVIDAVLVIDKRSGPSSHDVVAAVRRIVGHSRVGHTGTLDPLATGVLVLGLGRATRLVPFLQGGAKRYVATATLGVTTDSYDAMGVMTDTRDASHIDVHAVTAALTPFVGVIDQIPPMVSAVKIDGERLYVKARRGEVIDRPARTVRIDAIELETFHPGHQPSVTFAVTCGSGTYIRSIAHDLGVALGVGAHLTALRRTENSGFTLTEAVEVEALGSDTWLSHAIPLDTAVQKHMPVVTVHDPVHVRSLTHGAAYTDPPHDGPFAVRTIVSDGTVKLVGIYDASENPSGKPACVLLRPEELG